MRLSPFETLHGDFHGFTAAMVSVGLACRATIRSGEHLRSRRSTAQQCMSFLLNTEIWRAVFNRFMTAQSNLQPMLLSLRHTICLKYKLWSDVGGGHGATEWCWRHPRPLSDDERCGV